MDKRSKTASLVFDLIEPIAKEQGYDLVDTEYKKEGPSTFLRVFIDKKGGVDLDDCEKFSTLIDPIIDKNVKHDADYFEVSSPGLLRPLTELRDFIRYKGELIDVSLFEGEAFTDRIEDVKESMIVMTEHEIELKKISKAVRHIEF